MRRRMAGRLGRGGGPPWRQSAPFSPESQVLQEGEGELAQERVVVQAAPAPTLEVVQPPGSSRAGRGRSKARTTSSVRSVSISMTPLLSGAVIISRSGRQLISP